MPGKRGNRPFEILELDLSGFATYRELASIARVCPAANQIVLTRLNTCSPFAEDAPENVYYSDCDAYLKTGPQHILN